MRKPARVLAVAVAALVACSKSADKAPAPDSTAAQASPAAGSDGKAHRRKDGKDGKDSAGKREDRRDPVIADPPPLQLAVTVDGAAATWRKDAFDRVARYTGNRKANDGAARDVWSLRELAHALVGPTARVTSITGDDGKKPIERAAWDDASHTPLLHTTRRGTLKFRWADAGGAWGESEVKDVTRIEIAK